MATKKIKLATAITPIPRRRPRKLAKETVSLDQLSNGRFILGVGIGTPEKTEYDIWGEKLTKKVSGEMLDEGLGVIEGLWSGEPFTFQGQHYQVKDPVKFLPKPVQKPRIPIWVGGFWNYKNFKPFRRAAKYEGVIPIVANRGSRDPFAVIADIHQYILKHRKSKQPFDFAHIQTIQKSDKKIGDLINPFLDQGLVIWWMETAYNWGKLAEEQIFEKVDVGPPKL